MEEELKNVEQNNITVNSINNGTNVFNINIEIKAENDKPFFLGLFEKLINGFKIGLGWLKMF